jgi:selenocysteine-specific translation elongation factor
VTAVTVAVVGAREIAAALGKKGTQSDLTLYNAVRDGHQATLVEPSQYPEKFPPLLTALAMADRTVFVVQSLTKEIAEIAATLDVVGVPCEVRLGESVGEPELRRAFKGSTLETVPMATLNLGKLREEIDGWSAPARDGPVQVTIDHAFPVKGVGAVALGFVKQGVVHAHESLRLYPTEKTVEVRSIQVHDVDQREAGAGSRVGLAVKGVEADELSRGQVLAGPNTLTVGNRLEVLDWKKSRYYRGAAATGQTVQVQVGLQIVPGKWAALDGASGTLEVDRPIASEPGTSVIVADLSAAAGPRIEGRGRRAP